MHPFSPYLYPATLFEQRSPAVSEFRLESKEQLNIPIAAYVDTFSTSLEFLLPWN